MESTWGRHTHISCLFPEILAMIFRYLEVRDKGQAAQVCLSWRDAAYNRIVWRGTDAKLHLRRANPSLFPSLVKRGIRRVQILSLRRSLRDVIIGIPNIECMNLKGCFSVTDVGLGHAFIHHIPSLTTLNLSLCKQITDSTLGRIAQYLPNLEVLELGGCCNITTSGLMMLACGLKKLKLLNLRSCRHISDNGIEHLAGVSNMKVDGCLELEHIILHDCQKLTDQALKHISMGLSNLKSIDLSFCGSVTDSGLKFLAKMPRLKDLNLRNCNNISDIGVGYLAEGGSRITCLDVSFCERIGDQTLIHISQGIFHLRNLSICACAISDEGLNKVVRTAHDLTTLNIGQCTRVSDKGLGLIGDHLKNLEFIDLYGCTRITTVGLEKIMQLPKLNSLNLGLWHKRQDNRI